jgi:hypothetical protein
MKTAEAKGAKFNIIYLYPMLNQAGMLVSLITFIFDKKIKEPAFMQLTHNYPGALYFYILPHGMPEADYLPLFWSNCLLPSLRRCKLIWAQQDYDEAKQMFDLGVEGVLEPEELKVDDIPLYLQPNLVLQDGSTGQCDCALITGRELLEHSNTTQIKNSAERSPDQNALDAGEFFRNLKVSLDHLAVALLPLLLFLFQKLLLTPFLAPPRADVYQDSSKELQEPAHAADFSSSVKRFHGDAHGGSSCARQCGEAFPLALALCRQPSFYATRR